MIKRYYNFVILFTAVIISCNNKQVGNLNLPIGNWAENENDNVAFSTYNNQKIKYFENEGNFIYEITNDTLYIIEEKHPIAKYSILKISQDSIKLKTADGNILQFYNRK